MLTLFGEDYYGKIKLLGAALVAAVAIVAMGITLVYGVRVSERFRDQARGNCVQIEHLKGAITAVLEDGRSELERTRRDDLSARQFRDALDYYDRQIGRFRPRAC